MTYNLSSENPVSKFAFQVHNLQRYSEVLYQGYTGEIELATYAASFPETMATVGLCTLNQVDP
jgi:hypothetical protein